MAVANTLYYIFILIAIVLIVLFVLLGVYLVNRIVVDSKSPVLVLTAAKDGPEPDSTNTNIDTNTNMEMVVVPVSTNIVKAGSHQLLVKVAEAGAEEDSNNVLFYKHWTNDEQPFSILVSNSTSTTTEGTTEVHYGDQIRLALDYSNENDKGTCIAVEKAGSKLFYSQNTAYSGDKLDWLVVSPVAASQIGGSLEQGNRNNQDKGTFYLKGKYDGMDVYMGGSASDGEVLYSSKPILLKFISANETFVAKFATVIPAYPLEDLPIVWNTDKVEPMAVTAPVVALASDNMAPAAAPASDNMVPAPEPVMVPVAAPAPATVPGNNGAVVVAAKSFNGTRPVNPRVRRSMKNF